MKQQSNRSPERRNQQEGEHQSVSELQIGNNF